MTTSRVPALIDYLVSLFQNATTLGGPVVNGVQTGPVTVYDGPPTTAVDPGLKLYVGVSDVDSDAGQTAATFTQARADMGLATRDEISAVYCVAEAWTGDDTISAVRHSAAAIVAAVEALVRADQTRFGGSGFAQPGVNVAEIIQNNTSVGALARIPFQIQFRSFT